MPAITVRVKSCVASGFTPLWAVIVNWYVPAAVVVPDRVAVPSPLSWKVTLPGSIAPPSLRDGVGVPDVVTVNDPAVPAVNVVLLVLPPVIVGGVPVTVSVAVLLVVPVPPLLELTALLVLL